MAGTAYDLLVRIMGDATSLNDALRDADEESRARFGALQQHASGAAIALGGIALAGGMVIKSMLDQAAQMEVYRAKLTTVFHDAAKAAETMKWAVEFAAKTPFEVKGIVDATVQLSVYKLKAQEVLPLVGDLAAAMGAGIENTAQAVGKAMSGSLEGWEMLRNTYGVTIERLKAFGAAIDGQGQMLTKNSNDLDRNRKALLAVIATDFGGGMERQSKTFSGAMSNLQDSIHNLQTSIGETLIPAATSAVNVITEFSGKIKNMPDSMKMAAGWGTALATALAGIGAVGLGVIAILPNFTTGFATANAMLATFAATTGNTVVALKALIATYAIAAGVIGTAAIGAGAAIIYMGNEIQKNEKYIQDFTAAQSKNIVVAKESVEWMGKTAAELREMGVASADIPKALDGWRQLARAAIEIGRLDLAKKYQDNIRAIRDQGIALTEYNKKVDENFKLSGDAAKLAEHNAKIGLASARDVLAAEDSKLSAMKAFGATKDEIWAQEEKVYALRKKAEEDEKKTVKDTAKVHQDAADKKLSASLHFIDRKKTLNQMGEIEEINALNRVLRSHELTAEQRKGIIERLEDIAKKRAEDARDKKIAALEAEKGKAEETYKRKVELLNLEVAAFRKAQEDELALIAWRTQGELDQEEKLLAAKMQRMKTDTAILIAQERNLRIDGKTAEADAVAQKIKANNEAYSKLNESAQKNDAARWAKTWKEQFDLKASMEKDTVSGLETKLGKGDEKDAAVQGEIASVAEKTAGWYEQQVEQLQAYNKALKEKKFATKEEETAAKAQAEENNRLIDIAIQKAKEFHAESIAAQQKQADLNEKFWAGVDEKAKERKKRDTEEAAKEEPAAEKKEKERAAAKAGTTAFSTEERRKQLEAQIGGAGAPAGAKEQAGLRSAIGEMYGIADAQKMAALKKQYEDQGLLGTQQYKDAVQAAETEIRLAKLKTLEDHGVALKADYDAAVSYLTALIALLPKYGAAWQAANAELGSVKSKAAGASAAPAGKSTAPAATQKAGIPLGTVTAEPAGETRSGAAGPYASTPQSSQITAEGAAAAQAQKQFNWDASKLADKQGAIADKQDDASESLFKGATSSAQAAEKLDDAAQRMMDTMNMQARNAAYMSGMMGGISTAGAGGFFGGGGSSISDVERSTAGPSPRGASGGYEYGRAEMGREVSTDELNKLKATEGWYASGNSWTDMGNGRWWVM